MYYSTRFGGVDMIPKYNAGPEYGIFFIIFMVFCFFFVTNIFVGVLVSAFNREKEQLG